MLGGHWPLLLLQQPICQYLVVTQIGKCLALYGQTIYLDLQLHICGLGQVANKKSNKDHYDEDVLLPWPTFLTVYIFSKLISV